MAFGAAGALGGPAADAAGAPAPGPDALEGPKFANCISLPNTDGIPVLENTGSGILVLG